ncbi:hypothetical protein BH23GEM11_BH23GEM11_19760 [soil metagenome]
MPTNLDTPAGEPREIQLPAGLLDDLRTSAGPRVLESAGRSAGTWLAWNLRAVLATDDLSKAPSHAFWDALDEILRSRGWGRLRQERVHSGLGVIVAEEWIEGAQSDSDPSDPDPGCPFTVGLLSEVFGAVAGHPISVIETACEGHGNDTCRFVFGTDAAVAELRVRLDRGLSEEAALAAF